MGRERTGGQFLDAIQKNESDNPFDMAKKTVKKTSQSKVNPEVKRVGDENMEILKNRRETVVAERPIVVKQTTNHVVQERSPVFDLDSPECVSIIPRYHGKTPATVQSTNISVYMTIEEKALLRELAQSYGMQMNQFIRTLIVNTKKRGE